MIFRYSCDNGLGRLLPWMVLSDFIAIGCIYFDFCCYLKVSALELIFSMLFLDLDPGVNTLFFLIYHRLLNCSVCVYVVSRVVFWYVTFWKFLICTYPLELPFFFICCSWLCTYIKYTIRKVYTLPSCFHPICVDTYEFLILFQGVWVFHTKFTFLIGHWGCIIEVHY